MADIRKLETAPQMDDYAPAKVTYMGNVIEVVTRQKNSGGCPCIKLDADHYIDTRTGEVMEYNHIENRSESTRSIRNTLARIRALVNTNVTAPANVRWVTLTYAENMTDTVRLMKDYEKFWKKFLYWNSKQSYSRPEYICVIEPQGRGAWHVHAFFIWDRPAPYIDNNSVLAPMWGHGFTSCKALYDCDNVGAYFSAYLADMPVDDLERLTEDEKRKALSGCTIEEKTFTDEQDRSKTKKFVKGGRLYLYPPGMNIVRSTRGIKQPEVETMTASQAKEKVSSAKLTYSCSYEIVGDDGVVVNTCRKDYYNTARR